MDFIYEYNGKTYPVKISYVGDEFVISTPTGEYKVPVEVVKHGYLIFTHHGKRHKAMVSLNKRCHYVFMHGRVYKIEKSKIGKKKDSEEDMGLSAPITGVIVKMNVREGEYVKKGDVLCIMEAMKMEYIINAPKDGKISKILYKEGAQVEEGERIFYMDGEI